MKQEELDKITLLSTRRKDILNSIESVNEELSIANKTNEHQRELKLIGDHLTNIEDSAVQPVLECALRELIKQRDEIDLELSKYIR